MALYTERHGMREPIKYKSVITVEMYKLLFDCCEEFHDNIAWLYPEKCPDGQDCVGLNTHKFNDYLKYKIPTLFRDSRGQIAKPSNDVSTDDYDPYALFDLIEFIGQNCKDIEKENYHKFYRHFHLTLLESKCAAGDFRNKINELFKITGLSYQLTSDMSVERIVEHSVLTDEVVDTIKSVPEKGVKDLLEEAIALFKSPKSAGNKDAVEKIWDAFERLKTYHASLDKKTSSTKIIEDMSRNQPVFKQLLEDEFKKLTDIGNNYRIRHHETDRTEIQDIRHYDYLFNRCLSLICLAIQYLK